MLLRLNDRGDAVKELQAKLGLKADGHFGPVTQAAVIVFQKNHGLVADGIVGPSTLAKLGVSQTNNPAIIRVLTKTDFINAGAELQCNPAMIKALAMKETNGSAYLPDGRPKILFERHQFYKRLPIIRKPGQTQAQMTALRNQAFANDPDICNPKRGGYRGGAAEYERLARARKYSDTAALESASWGQFQIMGFNAVAIGYSSVQEFVRCMEQGIDQHLISLVRFCKATPKVLKGLRQQNFQLVAEGYNGPAYRENNYDTDLAKYFDRFKGEF